MWSLFALLIGFFLDLVIGDPQSFWHPVITIGKEISFLEKLFRKIFPKTVIGEKMAGMFLWFIIAILAFSVPLIVLFVCHKINPYFRLLTESVMCWQCLATKSLKVESMKVFYPLKDGNIEKARCQVSMIVGRDTKDLDDKGITRAAVETVAENTSDGIIAPMFFMVLGGAPLGFLYKAVNTMDSMLGYIEPPYKNVGMFSAKADDVFNFIPSRVSALFMLVSGGILKMNIKNGWKIFVRDRFNHKSPNSAQTESVCAGLLGLRLAGDAYYHGVLHKKKYIGDELRQIEYDDIPRVCHLLYVTSFLSLILMCLIKWFVIF